MSTMKTKALYLTDSYLKGMEAKILEVKSEGMNLYRILLDKTVFYPMGGGQPTDQGVLEHEMWKAEIYMGMMKDGEIWHYLKSPVSPEINWSVKGTINWDRRYKNMRVHSAGHVIDFAMYLLGFSPKTLLPFKGDHGKKPFIIYQGTLTGDIRSELEQKANELVENNLGFTMLFQPLEDLKKEALYLQSGLPTDKPLRTLRLEGVGAVADGGTQVLRTKEVGKIQILPLEIQNGLTVVNYRI